MRKITAKHDESSASRIEARVREIVGGGELLDASRGKRGEGMGVRLGFIGRGCCGMEGKERGTAMAFHTGAFHVGATAAVACRSGARHRRGREGKERGEEGKGMVAADGWGRQRDEGEG